MAPYCADMATITLMDARAEYFDENGFGADGGYTEPFVFFHFGPLPMAFPNTPARQKVVPYHDVHHLVTGYQTDLVGEAEIGGWELGSGCGRAIVAWVLNAAAMGTIFPVAPLRVLRAFARGRQSDNVYGRDYEPLLTRSVADVQQELRLDQPVVVRPVDVALFALGLLGAWALIIVALPTLPLVMLSGAWHRFRQRVGGAASDQPGAS